MSGLVALPCRRAGCTIATLLCIPASSVYQAHVTSGTKHDCTGMCVLILALQRSNGLASKPLKAK